MAETVATKTGRGKTKYLCGTPVENCGGSLGILSNGFKGKGYKLHNSPVEAFRCASRHLVKIGFEKLSSREFRAPDGSGIRVLTKPSRFGSPMRAGKAGRSMPSVRTGGTITSC